MSVTSQNNIMDVFVVKDVAPTAYSGITNIFDTVSGGLADGEIGVVGFNASTGKEEKVATSNSLTLYPYIRFVQRLGTELFYGSEIYPRNIAKVTCTAYAAPTEQLYYIGYNGTSGSLDVSQANEFILTIAYDHDDMMWSEQKLRNAYDYYSPAPTQQGLAASMVSQINYKENLGALNGTGRMVRAEMMSDGTAAVVSDGTQTQDAIVVQDSVSVRLVDTGTSTAGDLAGCQSSAPVGTVVNIAGVKYIVQSIATVGGNTVMTLNTPYQGTSGTITGGTTVASQFCKMSAITNYGIRVSGQSLTWVKDFFKYNKVKFHFDLKGFGSSQYDRPGSLTLPGTGATNSKESYKGIGWFQEVSEYESFAAGNQGALNRMVVPLPLGRTMTATNSSVTAYNVWRIEMVDTNNASPIVATTPMRIQEVIFFPDTTNGNNMQGLGAGAGLINATSYNIDDWFTLAGFTVSQV